MCQSVLNYAAECVLGDHLGLVLRSLDSLVGCLGDTSAFKSGYLADFAAEFLGELLDIYFVAVLLYDIHHVDRSDYRDTELNELGGQVEVTFKVGTVDDVQYRVGAFAYKVISRYDFLKCVGRERINTRQVGDDDVLASFQPALFLLDRNARPVSDELVGAGQRVEERCLAAVRVTCERYPYVHLFSPLKSAPYLL